MGYVNAIDKVDSNIELSAFALSFNNTGPWLEQVRPVQLHPLILANGCMHPSIFRLDTSFRRFCPIFPANEQILHPSIEMSNQGTDTYSQWRQKIPLLHN